MSLGQIEGYHRPLSRQSDRPLGRMFRPRENFVSGVSVFQCWDCTARTRNGMFSRDDRFRCYDCFSLPRSFREAVGAARSAAPQAP
jgi:hypothetical protein